MVTRITGPFTVSIRGNYASTSIPNGWGLAQFGIYQFGTNYGESSTNGYQYTVNDLSKNRVITVSNPMKNISYTVSI